MGRRVDAVQTSQGLTNDKLSDDIQSTSQRLTTSIETNVQDIIDHLKIHAETIENLQQERSTRMRKMPSVHEIAQMRADMDGVKTDVKEATFRVQEIFSACQAMYAGAQVTKPSLGSQVAVSRQNNNGKGSGNNNSRDGSGAITPEPAKTSSYGPGSSDLLHEAQSILAGISKASESDGDSKLHGGGMPTSVELQIDMLKRDVNRVVTLVVPSCITQIQNLKDQVEATVSMSSRAQTAYIGLCEAVGLPDGGDELLAACIAADYNKAIVQLRNAFSVIAAGGYNYPSPRRSIELRAKQADSTMGLGNQLRQADAQASDLLDELQAKNPQPVGTPPPSNMGAKIARPAAGSPTHPQQGSNTVNNDHLVNTPSPAAAAPAGEIKIGSPYRPREVVSTPIVGNGRGSGGSTTTTSTTTNVVAAGYDERYSTLPKLNALHESKFALDKPASKNKNNNSGGGGGGGGAPTLGVDCADHLGGEGVQIMATTSGSAAARAGLGRGDRIVALNGRSVKNCAEFVHALSTTFILTSAANKRKIVLSVVKHGEKSPIEVSVEY